MCLIQTYKMNMISSSSSAHCVLPVDVNNQWEINDFSLVFCDMAQQRLTNTEFVQTRPCLWCLQIYIVYTLQKVQNQLFSSILIFNFIFCLFRFQDQWIFIELTDILEMLYYYINCQYVLKFKTDAHFSIAFEMLY